MVDYQEELVSVSLYHHHGMGNYSNTDRQLMFTKCELKELLKRPPVPDVLRTMIMDGDENTDALVDAIIKARDAWHKEQWPG